MAVRRVLVVALFLFFADDTGTVYGSHWITPFGWLRPIFFLNVPYKIRVIDHIFIACLFFSSGSEGRGPRVPPMRQALLVGAATLTLWFVFGVTRGGDARAASWQVYLMMSGILAAFSIASAFRTPAHFGMLAKMLLAAAVYRAAMCCLYYVIAVAPSAAVPPDFITSHDDTVLWVVAVLLLFLRVIEATRTGERLSAVALILLLLCAIQFNQRRLAWVSLGMGMIVLSVMIPKGKAKRRLLRWATVSGPVFLLYAIVGWGRPEKIFKPLQSFATVTTSEDASTKARNVENLGLVATANTNPLMGTGWGHKYIEVSNKYSIAEYFELWPYVPHNSVLGLLAYTGILGFYGYWLAFPTAMFLNARLGRIGDTPAARRVGLVGAAQLVVCANQCYGDMGLFSSKTVYIMSLSQAIALRLPLSANAWPARKESVFKRAPSPAAPARIT